MYNIWQITRSEYGINQATLAERNIATLEEAQDITDCLTLTACGTKEYIAILQGGKAEPVIQQIGRWTEIGKLTPYIDDDAGCDWITIGDETYIGAIDWHASSNPRVAQLVRESHAYKGYKDLIYADEADYWKRNPELVGVVHPAL